jgi:hypothetical protein
MNISSGAVSIKGHASFPATACIMLIKIPLAKASYMAETITEMRRSLSSHSERAL